MGCRCGGYWKPDEYGTPRCSECGTEAPFSMTRVNNQYARALKDIEEIAYSRGKPERLLAEIKIVLESLNELSAESQN